MSLALATLEVLLLLLSLTGAAFYLWSALGVLSFFSQPKPTPVDEPGGVSLLVPVCGVDAGAWENWSSLCEQTHPSYEVLFGVQNDQDPAIPVLEKLAATYPDRCRWYLCADIEGINRKISNLRQLLKNAHHDIIVFADSDIRVTPDYLTTVTALLENPELGVVTCGYFDHHPQGIGAAISALGRCIDFIPSVLIARSLDRGLRFAIGPTVVIRRQVLAAIGGLDIALNRIGDDYRVGYEAWAAGFKVELSTYVLQNDCGQEPLQQVWQRELRWARTIRSNRGNQYYGMGLTYGTVYSIFLVLVSGEPAALWFCLAIHGLRWGQAIISMVWMKAPGLLAWVWLLPLRDGLNFLIWLLGCFGQQVYWRGRWLRVHRAGKLQEIVKKPHS
ncbi:glycosyltransferase [Candidatus Synechococcus calcipolaris G9]|uniref:Glycosyltransferase n=1 Tax=Candidatus Synechococcus calcipolaris G9 TaxID=1497997 RepID=A0ABT6F0X3_9SYNE|nr:glycosyltransferase [Candidatus Synechococcus calcipolaris]MDG2991500.1 glycosyltransferase [Candidatus Synechococcus calcipolaris G9]